MIVCVDPNVLVQARAINHAYGPILNGFALGTLSWAVSVRVMLEYEEIIRSKASAAAWETVLRLMNLMEMNSRLLLVSPHFQFHVIGADPDDNAFTDCAIAVGADFIITEDAHFAPLAKAGYKPLPIHPIDFIERYRGEYV